MNILHIIACYLFAAALLMPCSSFGQNLVPNPSFEDINICAEYSQPCSPSAWFFIENLTVGYVSADNIKSATGLKHLNILVAKRNGMARQYWETMLLCKLIKGRKYWIKAKLSSEKMGPNLNDLGFYFSDSFMFSKRDTVLQPEEYFNFTGGKIRSVKHGWFEVEKEITMTSNAQFLIIGNFSKNPDSAIFTNRNNPFEKINVLVDDLSIESEEKTICPGFKKTKDSLYSIHNRHPHFTETISIRAQTDTSISLKKNENHQIDTITLKNVLFKVNSYLLQDENILNKYEKIFKQPGVRKIIIVGFTDSTGTQSYNLTLSQKRADAVSQLIKKKFTLPGSVIIETTGEGVSDIYKNNAGNRRVDIYILH